MCCVFLFADRGLVGKRLIIFIFLGVLLHAIHRNSLQKKLALSRKPNIETKTQIYFIRPGFREFFLKCVSIWTSIKLKNVDEFFPLLF